MLNRHILAVLESLDMSVKLTMGIVGCFAAPIMIWTGLGLLIATTLIRGLEAAYPAYFSLGLFLLGFLWQLTTIYTFGDEDTKSTAW